MFSSRDFFFPTTSHWTRESRVYQMSWTGEDCRFQFRLCYATLTCLTLPGPKVYLRRQLLAFKSGPAPRICGKGKARKQIEAVLRPQVSKHFNQQKTIPPDMRLGFGCPESKAFSDASSLSEDLCARVYTNMLSREKISQHDSHSTLVYQYERRYAQRKRLRPMGRGLATLSRVL